MLTGNLVAILSSGLICVIVSMIKPDNCDWTTTKSIELIEQDDAAELTPEEEAGLERAMKIISSWGFGLTILLVIVWPVLTIPAGVFSQGYFTFWVILSFLWGILSTAAMLILPVAESFAGMKSVLTKSSERKGEIQAEKPEVMEDS